VKSASKAKQVKPTESDQSEEVNYSQNIVKDVRINLGSQDDDETDKSKSVNEDGDVNSEASVSKTPSKFENSSVTEGVQLKDPLLRETAPDVIKLKAEVIDEEVSPKRRSRKASKQVEEDWEEKEKEADGSEGSFGESELELVKADQDKGEPPNDSSPESLEDSKADGSILTVNTVLNAGKKDDSSGEPLNGTVKKSPKGNKAKTSNSTSKEDDEMEGGEEDQTTEKSSLPKFCLEALAASRGSKAGSYFLRQINNAPLIMEPFPHVFIEKIFEPEFYRKCILAALPRRQDTEKVYTQHTNGSSHHVLQLATKGVVQMEAVNRNGRKAPIDLKSIDQFFWTTLASSLSSPRLISAWVSKFSPTLSHRGLDKYASRTSPGYWSGFSSSMILVRDQKGFAGTPSAASADKWVWTEYQLPSGEDEKDALGTKLLKSKSGRKEKAYKRESFDNDDLEVIKRLPYIPNSVFAYAPCVDSWTSVFPIRRRIQRNSLLGIIHHNPIGLKQQCGSEHGEGEATNEADESIAGNEV